MTIRVRAPPKRLGAARLDRAAPRGESVRWTNYLFTARTGSLKSKAPFPRLRKTDGDMNSLGTSALFLVACALSALDALGQTALDSPASETPTQDYPRAASLNAAPSGTSEIPQSDQSSASNSTPRVARSDRNLHDGFYLRLALGGGSTSWTRGKHHDEETAPAGLYDVALGGTIGPGVVLGGGLFNTVADLDGLYRLTVLAPFVDYYFNPHEGLHMQFALGAAVEESE